MSVSLPVVGSAPPPPASAARITPRLTRLKARIFCHGVRIPADTWEKISDANHYKHKRAGVSNGRFFRLDDGTASTVVNAPVLEPFVEASPLHLVERGGGYHLYEGDEPVATCEPVPWPRWYRKTTSAGVPMSLVVSAHSTHSLYTAIYQGGCDYFSGGNECKFCAMKIDNKTEWRKVEPIIEVARAALEEDPAAEISFGGGTRLTPDKGAKHDIAAVRAFKKAVDMPVSVEMAPPDTDDWLDALHDAGCDSLMLNVELWGPEVRRSLMPGKSKIPRERYIAALEYAVGLFGAHQVSSQVIVGLEPIESTLEAIDAVAATGAIPLPTVFRPLKNTELVGRRPPSVEDVLGAFDRAVEAIHARGMLPDKTRAGCALCGACSAHR